MKNEIKKSVQIFSEDPAFRKFLDKVGLNLEQLEELVCYAADKLGLGKCEASPKVDPETLKMFDKLLKIIQVTSKVKNRKPLVDVNHLVNNVVPILYYIVRQVKENKNNPKKALRAIKQLLNCFGGLRATFVFLALADSIESVDDLIAMMITTLLLG